MLALEQYHHDYERFPPPEVPNDRLAADRRLSWMVLILPYLEEQSLYNGINLEQAWDSPANSSAARTSVEVYLSPTEPDRRDAAGYALAHVAGVSGWEDELNGIFARSTSLAEITDGAASTAIIGEIHHRPGPWIAAGPSTVRAMRAPLNNDALSFGSGHNGGLHIGLADGSVRFISEAATSAVLRGLATIAAGDQIDLDSF
jgi:Protein of unknown function (DUF1559)